MATILITGGTGLIGSALSRLLIEKGYRVILLSRQTGEGNQGWGMEHLSPGPAMAHWDPTRQTIDAEAIRQADAIIHLAGAGVADKRWSHKRKKEIVESRIDGCALIVKALKEIPNKVQTVISASGIGWYGEDSAIPNPRPFEETDAPDGDFLGETCRLWEAAIEPVTALGKRLVILRTGIVLSKKGGALEEFKKPLRLGVAAILGSGKQIISWIHLEDLCRLYLQGIEDAAMTGVYNAVAPRPLDNRSFTLELGKRMKGRFFVPVYIPSFVLKIVLGEMSIEVLKSATISEKKTRQTGFQFLYPSVGVALDDLFSR